MKKKDVAKLIMGVVNDCKVIPYNPTLTCPPIDHKMFFEKMMGIVYVFAKTKPKGKEK